MDALMLHRKIVSGYEDYIRSFIDIYDDDIRTKVEKDLSGIPPYQTQPFHLAEAGRYAGQSLDPPQPQRLEARGMRLPQNPCS